MWNLIMIVMFLINSQYRTCPRVVVIEGDSFSVTGAKWPLYLKDSSYFFSTTTQINYAVSGAKASDMRDEYLTEAHTSKPVRGQDYWFFCYAGVNDLAGANKSADTVFNNLKYIFRNARDDHYKTVAFTVIHSLTMNAGKEAQRVLLNQKILDSSHLFDKVIDIASYFDPRTQPELFVDDTHLTTEGFKMFEGIVASALVPDTLNPCRPIYLSTK